MKIARLLSTSILFLLLLCSNAYAADWALACGSSSIQNSFESSGISSRCVPLVSGDLDSVVISTASCENIDALYFDDSSTTTVQVLSCATSACTESFPVENLTLTGTSPNEAIYGFAANFVKIDGTTNPTSGTPYVILRCNR